MGQSLIKNYLHIIFSTKHRQNLIYPPYENKLHAYLGGTCKSLECPVLAVGGHTDHIHILCNLSKNIALKVLLQKVKASSSRWMKTKHPEFKNFYWQDGYAAFSVNPKGVETVVRYIKTQHEHHRKQTFQKEHRSFLEKHNIEYDERYVWD